MQTNEIRLGEAVSIDGEVTTAQEGHKVSRRGFFSGMGAMMAGAALAYAGTSKAFAQEADDAEADVAEEETTTESSGSALTGWHGTPDDVLALGVSTMPLADLNEYRQKYLDAQTEYVCEDGTVIALPYVKMRALIHTYGMGMGGEPTDASFEPITSAFTEEQASAYLEMPRGVEFTAYEYAAETDRTVEEAEELCELFAGEGFLCAYDNNRGRCYHQVPFFQGVAEYGFTRSYENNGTLDHFMFGADFYSHDMPNTGTPTFYYVPVDKSVTSDGTILPFDDLKEKIKANNLVAICPCPCRYSALYTLYDKADLPTFEDFQTGEYEDYFSDICNQRVETCIMTGDEAAYWIEMGWGRQITGEQAAEYLQRSADDGFMLETTFGKNTETICSCHVDSCGILGMWNAIGDADTIAACDSFKQVSHYRLEVDPDKCIACGLCVDRCPMHIISINDEGWAEPAANCFRCGQCAYVCPQGARKLVERDESELAPLPQGMIEDMNVKAAYRFETGVITIPEA